jgi:hypothetical protein
MEDYHQINGFWVETCRNLFSHGKNNCRPLTLKQWEDAFDTETGRLLNGNRILQRIRHGVRNFFFFLLLLLLFFLNVLISGCSSRMLLILYLTFPFICAGC